MILMSTCPRLHWPLTFLVPTSPEFQRTPMHGSARWECYLWPRKGGSLGSPQRTCFPFEQESVLKEGRKK